MTTKKYLSEIEGTMKSILSSIDDLRDHLLHVKDSVIKALQEKNHNLKFRLRQLEMEFMDSSNHSRRKNIVITGISPSIKANELEPIAIRILAAVNVDVSTKEIYAVHRLHTDDEKSMPTIISFTNKNQRHALAHRQLLKNLNMESIGLNRKTSLYINENVC